MSRRHVGKGNAKDLARERIDRLFVLAEQQAVAGNHKLSRRYVSLALRMGERHKVRAGHKRTYCPSCHAYFLPSQNMRVRLTGKRITLTCLSCGRIVRFPIGSNKR